MLCHQYTSSLSKFVKPHVKQALNWKKKKRKEEEEEEELHNFEHLLYTLIGKEQI